ncbi:MAG: phenylalanine--tRNA ligase subunit alpha [Nitrospirales bacterium]|nr:phenylalanine--tRNA ligase subunit alpha [Nitrospirales bacterium]
MNSPNNTDSLHPLEIQVLRELGKYPQPLSDLQLANQTELAPSQVSMAVGWLLTKQLVSLSSETTTTYVSLTSVGAQYHQPDSSPLEWIIREANDAVPRGKLLTVKDLQNDLKETGQFQPSELSRAIGILKKEGVLQMGVGGMLEITSKASETERNLRSLLDQIHKGPRPLDSFASDHQALLRLYAVKRGNTQEPFRIDDYTERTYVLTAEGRNLLPHLREGAAQEISQLTPELLKDGSWRNVSFRKYSINLRPPRLAVGKRHSYREFLDTVKYKLTSMGFQEMRGELIETEFWDMDALFMPQFHPARAIHDVYFVKNPKMAKKIPEPFHSQVGQVHRDGGTSGSKGWKYEYDSERAKRLVLRSQGTAVSARTLAQNPPIPSKFFSIARCFRYDNVDATHATDFFQVEGIVLGSDINFRTLLGLLQLFATEMAQAKEIRFFPAYFPFTEPSVELHVRHPKLGWMELGGAGLFRSEVTVPLGVTVPVIAWGLGLDRMAMVALGIQDIRDLFTSDLEAVRNMRRQF